MPNSRGGEFGRRLTKARGGGLHAGGAGSAEALLGEEVDPGVGGVEEGDLEGVDLAVKADFMVRVTPGSTGNDG